MGYSPVCILQQYLQVRSMVNCSVENKMGYNEYIAKRNKKLEENQKIQTLEQDVSTMKEDLNEIKSLLKEIINGSQRNNS